MVSIDTFRKLALSFPEATEESHFENIKKRACIILSEIDQDVFSSADKTIIFPVDNKWGKQGWTLIEMSKVRKELFIDALTTAYCEVAPKKLSDQIRQNDNE